LNTRASPPASSRTSAVALALFVVFLWATSWVLIKFGLREIPALTFAGLRYGLAALVLMGSLFATRGAGALRSMSASAWVQLALLGILLYAVTQGAIFLALSVMPAVTVNLLWSFSTILVAVLGALWLAETPTVLQWSGVALAAAGAIVSSARQPWAAGRDSGSSSPWLESSPTPSPPSSAGK
jgi:drug/metabolite transporter (DMT)-like permease